MKPVRHAAAAALAAAVSLAACSKPQATTESDAAPTNVVAPPAAPRPTPESVAPPPEREPVDLSLKPCTGKNDPANCVKCGGNANGVCSRTESIFVTYDIKKGYLTHGQEGRGSCYECLWGAGCIDDTVNIDKNRECEDLKGTVDAGPKASATKTDACYDTVQCILDSGCQNARAQVGPSAWTGISNCFCGSSYPTTPACLGATATPNGSCYVAELNGLGATPTTAVKTVLGEFTNRTFSAGMANSIFLCAGSNSGTVRCPSCFQ